MQSKDKPWNYMSLGSVLFRFEKNTFKHSFRFFNHYLAVNKKLKNLDEGVSIRNVF